MARHLLYAVVLSQLLVLLPLLPLAQEKKPVISPDTDTLGMEHYHPQKIRTVIKSNPLAMFFGAIPIITAEYRFLYEAVVSKNQSSQFGLSYLGKGPLISLLEDSTAGGSNEKFQIRGFRAQFSHRFFFNKFTRATGMSNSPYAPKGVYFSPHISYSSAQVTTRSLKARGIYLEVIHFNINLLTGCQFFIGDSFAVDLYAGLGYKKNAVDEHFMPNRVRTAKIQDLGRYYNGPVKISLGMNLGWRR